MLKSGLQRTQITISYFSFIIGTHIYLFSPPKRFLRKDILEYNGKIDGSVGQIEEINAGDLTIDANDIDYIRGIYEGGLH